MISHLQILIAVVSALFLIGCATPTFERKIFTVSDSQTYFLEETSHPDTDLFNRTIQAAIAGDDGALSTILSWKQLTDGEGALNYSSMLLDVRAKVGPARFERAMQTLKPEDQARVLSSLDASSRMRQLVKNNGPR
jgi:outer membrane biogenesis lipoprotein LolB